MENLSDTRLKSEVKSRDFRREDAYLRAKKRVESIKGFYWHFAIYILVNIFIVSIIVYNTDASLFSLEALSTPLFWGIGLFFHFAGVFGTNFLFGSDWEKRKIKKFMDKDMKNWDV